MPEAAEVQIIIDYLNDNFVNKRVTDVFVTDNVFNRNATKIMQLKGGLLLGIERKAKYLIWKFSNGMTVLNHLAMSGSWIEGAGDDVPKHVRLCFIFDNHKVLYFIDPRKYGRFIPYTNIEFQRVEKEKLSKLGIDSLRDEITPQYISEFIFQHEVTMPIKPLLMEQKFIGGLGNIYAAEICFLAKVHPDMPASDLLPSQVEAIAEAIKPVITNAYNSGGSSVRDYAKPDGTKGEAQTNHFVYRKKICSICGSKIEKIKQYSRTTYFCPVCQLKR